MAPCFGNGQGLLGPLKQVGQACTQCHILSPGQAGVETGGTRDRQGTEGEKMQRKETQRRRVKVWSAQPHLCGHHTSEAGGCTFQEETSDEEAEEDDVG